MSCFIILLLIKLEFLLFCHVNLIYQKYKEFIASSLWGCVTFGTTSNAYFLYELTNSNLKGLLNSQIV